MSKNLQDYLRNDRQWMRSCRIAHANYQLGHAKTDDERRFWLAVLEANGYEVQHVSAA